MNADQVLGVAASQVGYCRTSGARTKFGEWYGLPTGQWCAMFVSWCAAQAGAASIIPKHAYTPSGAAWFKGRRQWHSGLGGVVRGDIVYFDFPGLPNRISHVGFVESVNGDGSVNTIEGNTSGMSGGSQRNGGLCARKRRKSYAVGYGRPAYQSVSAHPTIMEDDMFDVTDRARAKAIETKLTRQGRLYTLFETVDGRLGVACEQAPFWMLEELDGDRQRFIDALYLRGQYVRWVDDQGHHQGTVLHWGEHLVNSGREPNDSDRPDIVSNPRAAFGSQISWASLIEGD